MIRLVSYEPYCVTPREYEQLLKEITARHMAGDITLGDQIIAKLLQEHESRYHEIKGDYDAAAEDEIDR